MEKLPVELLECILKHCTVKDVLNVCCCNKNHYTLLKPILWRSVRIPILSLRAGILLEPYVENLKYTNHLNIVENLSTMELFKDNEEEETDDYNNEEHYESMDEVKVLSALREALDAGSILARLISYCDSSKVVSLRTSVNGLCLESILLALPHLKTLALHLKRGIGSIKIHQLLQLDELELNVSVVAVEKGIIGGESLRKLKVTCHYTIPDDAFIIDISKLRSLEELQIKEYCFGVSSNDADIGPLSTLTNLIHLTVRKALTSDVLKLLCQSLTKLKSLNLDGSYLSDDGLSDAHCLTSLTHLSLKYCHGISTNCLLHLVTLPLRSISFCSTIHEGEDGVNVDMGIAGLNQISTLMKVVVSSRQAKKASMAVITDSLCHKKKWILSVEKFIGTTDRIFTR